MFAIRQQVSPTDADGDGYSTAQGDCDDHDATVYPGAPELCDGKDNNCNGQIDEGVQTTFYRDADGDGYGNPTSTTQACTVPTGYVTNSTDCNDTNAAIHPGATEVCNGVDDNCNGQIDEAFADLGTTCSVGVGACQQTGTKVCTASRTATQCNATPGTPSPEICGDGIDQNCNGADAICPLTVLSPNGGEVWPINSTQTVRWYPTGVSGKVRIELSRDGGATWKALANSTANTGAPNWKVNKPATTRARIRVSSVLTPSVRDTSNGDFTIK